MVGSPDTKAIHSAKDSLWSKKVKSKIFPRGLTLLQTEGKQLFCCYDEQTMCQTLFLNRQPSSTFAEEVVRVNKTLVPNILHCGKMRSFD